MWLYSTGSATLLATTTAIATMTTTKTRATDEMKWDQREWERVVKQQQKRIKQNVSSYSFIERRERKFVFPYKLWSCISLIIRLCIEKKMFALTFSVYQAQTIWLMLIYNKMKAWFCEAYENIGGEWVNVVCRLRRRRQMKKKKKEVEDEAEELHTLKHIHKQTREPKNQMPMEWAYKGKWEEVKNQVSNIHGKNTLVCSHFAFGSLYEFCTRSGSYGRSTQQRNDKYYTKAIAEVASAQICWQGKRVLSRYLPLWHYYYKYYGIIVCLKHLKRRAGERERAKSWHIQRLRRTEPIQKLEQFSS